MLSSQAEQIVPTFEPCHLLHASCLRCCDCSNALWSFFSSCGCGTCESRFSGTFSSSDSVRSMQRWTVLWACVMVTFFANEQTRCRELLFVSFSCYLAHHGLTTALLCTPRFERTRTRLWCTVWLVFSKHIVRMVLGLSFFLRCPRPLLFSRLWVAWKGNFLIALVMKMHRTESRRSRRTTSFCVRVLFQELNGKSCLRLLVHKSAIHMLAVSDWFRNSFSGEEWAPKTEAHKAAVSVNATHRETPTKTQTLTPCLRMIFTALFPRQKTFSTEGEWTRVFSAATQFQGVPARDLTPPWSGLS